MKYLQEKENRLKEDTEEHANVAQRRPSQSDNDNQQKRTGACYLCFKRHMARDCPYLEIAQDAVKHAMRALSKSHSSKSYSRKTGKSSDKKDLTPASSAKRDEKKPSPHKKSHRLAAVQTSRTDDSDTATDSSQDLEDTDLEDTDETILLSHEQICKAQPST